jgi:hypothetical protein
VKNLFLLRNLLEESLWPGVRLRCRFVGRKRMHCRFGGVKESLWPFSLCMCVCVHGKVGVFFLNMPLGRMGNLPLYTTGTIMATSHVYWDGFTQNQPERVASTHGAGAEGGREHL